MNLKHAWQLDPSLTFLNHGCFGAVPRVVSETRRQLEMELERDPVEYLAPERNLEPKLDEVRARVAELVCAGEQNLVFVRNATDGVNAVLRSMPLVSGDEIVITNHGYNACNNVARFVADRSGAVVRVAEIPFPIESPQQVIDSVDAVMSQRTRLVLIDHVTSPTALVFPIQELIALAHDRGARIMIDGAHAAGMLPLEIEKLAPDYYTANHHKWLCAPKVSGFLYVDPKFHDEVQPSAISHPYNTQRPGRSIFTASFDWVGTYDPTPILAVPAALQFLSSLHDGGFEEHLKRNQERLLSLREMVCGAAEIDFPSPASMLGSMLTLPICNVEPNRAEWLGRTLREDFGIEIPVYAGLRDAHGELLGTTLMRISFQAYNEMGDIQKLVNAMAHLGLTRHSKGREA